MITGPWNVQKDGTVTTVAGTHTGTRVVARCERMEDAKAIALVPELLQALREVVQDQYESDFECKSCGDEVAGCLSGGLSDRIEALIERAEGLRG